MATDIHSSVICEIILTVLYLALNILQDATRTED